MGNWRPLYHTADEGIYHLIGVKTYERLLRRTRELKNQVKARLRRESIIC
jgi:hypothetical protein